MNPSLEPHRLKQPLDDDTEPGVRRFRVIYLAVNGRRTVVPAWKLRDTLQALKVLTRYAPIAGLANGESVEIHTMVHRRPLALQATAGIWEIRDGRGR